MKSISALLSPAKAFFALFLALAGLFLFAQPINAQSYQNEITQISGSQSRAVNDAVVGLVAGSVCTLSGIDIMAYAPPEYSHMKANCLTFDPSTRSIGQDGKGQGIIGLSNGMMTLLYQPPATTVEFTNYLASNFGVTQKAHAQATGFEGLSALVSVWAVFRDVAYLLMAIAFIIVGFVIMLRVKIDPRTVMSIQNMLPRLVAAIIFITFSYTIAGLLVDVMWASTYLSVSVMSDAIEESEPAFLAGDYDRGEVTANLQDYPFRFFNQIFFNNFAGLIPLVGTLEFSRQVADGAGLLFRSATNSTGDDTGEAVGQVSFAGLTASYLSEFMKQAGPVAQEEAAEEEEEDDGGGLGDAIRGSLGLIVDPFGAARDYGLNLLGLPTLGGIPGAITGAAGEVLSNVLSAGFTFLMGVISWLLAALVFLVILVAIIVTLFRIWFTLLRAYIVILLGVVWAPFWILFGVLPGSGINFTQWLRHMVAHLALFPATVIMFLMARVFINVFEPQNIIDSPSNLFLPPLVGNINIPEAIGPLIAFGILMYIPSTLNIIRDALKTPASKYNSTVGAGAAVGWAVVGGTGKNAYSRVSHRNEGVYDAPSGNYVSRGLFNIFGKRIGGGAGGGGH